MKHNKKALMIIVIFIALAIFSTKVMAACVVPYENMQITQDTTLCAGTYYLNDSDKNGAIQIATDNVMLDCNNAHFIGNKISNSRLVLINSDNVKITNCILQDYFYGLTTTNNKGDYVSIYNNTFLNIVDSGYYSYAKRDTQIFNNKFNNSEMYLNSNIDSKIFGNIFSNCSTHNCGGSRNENLRLDGSSNIEIYGNTFDTGEVGIYIYSSNNNNALIHNNIFTNHDRGMKILNANNLNGINIHDNTFQNNSNNFDAYQLDIEALNSSNIIINHNNFIESPDVSLLLVTTNHITITNNNFDLVCINNRDKYLGNAQNEPCTAIMIKQLYKTWCYAQSCTSPYTYDAVSTSSSSNIIVNDNTFDSDTNVYLFLQGASNITTNLQNYWYRSFRFDNFAGKEELYINSNWNEVRNNIRYFNKTSSSKSLYEGYELSNINKYFGIKNNESYFRNIASSSESYSLSLFNLTTPFNDIKDSSTSQILASNVNTYSITLSPGQQIEVGNFVADPIINNTPINNTPIINDTPIINNTPINNTPIINDTINDTVNNTPIINDSIPPTNNSFNDSSQANTTLLPLIIDVSLSSINSKFSCNYDVSGNDIGVHVLWYKNDQLYAEDVNNISISTGVWYCLINVTDTQNNASKASNIITIEPTTINPATGQMYGQVTNAPYDPKTGTPIINPVPIIIKHNINSNNSAKNSNSSAKVANNVISSNSVVQPSLEQPKQIQAISLPERIIPYFMIVVFIGALILLIKRNHEDKIPVQKGFTIKAPTAVLLGQIHQDISLKDKILANIDKGSLNKTNLSTYVLNYLGQGLLNRAEVSEIYQYFKKKGTY